MKYFKRSGLFKASNVEFNPETLRAFSYQWWCFVSKVDGYVVFNNYRYSSSTSRHQAKVRRLMQELNIKIDFMLPVPKGLPGTYRKSYSMGDTVTDESETIEGLITLAEEHLCEQFLKEKLKAQDRYHDKKEKIKKQREKEALMQAQEEETGRPIVHNQGLWGIE